MFARLMKSVFQLLIGFVLIYTLFITGSGCANIIPPAGGPRDSLPPRLVSVTPKDSSRNIRPSKINFTFSEYIAQMQNTEGIVVSPTLNVLPVVESHLKTVTVKIKDTLEANTTYSINFGNTIRDVNEGNILQNFTYVFSTGNTIDSNSLTGKVILAENGKTDSTLIVVLHSNLSDTAITKLRPRYYTTLNGEGAFRFENLPATDFLVYVVPKESFTKQYDSTRLFAFLNTPVKAAVAPTPVTLYAYVESPVKPKTTPPPAGNKPVDKRLRYSLSETGTKDILTPLQLQFTRKLASIDTNKIFFTDTSYRPLAGVTKTLDTSATRLTIRYPWKLSGIYKLIIVKDAVADAEGVTLTRNDTLTIYAKKAEEYGSVKLRFNNVDLSKNPVLQLVQNETVIESIPITGREWKREFFKPGEYDIRILLDDNKNGKWDTGNFLLKKQPEKVISINRQLNVKGNWENETEINLN